MNQYCPLIISGKHKLHNLYKMKHYSCVFVKLYSRKKKRSYYWYSSIKIKQEILTSKLIFSSSFSRIFLVEQSVALNMFCSTCFQSQWVVKLNSNFFGRK